MSAGIIAMGAMQAFSMIQKGKQVEANEQYNASLYRANNVLAIAAAEFEAKKIEDNGNKLIAKQQARYAKSGVRFEGSPVEVFMESVKAVELDIFATEYNTKAALISSNSSERLALMRSKYAKRQGYYDAFASILQTGGNLYLNQQ